MARLAYNRNSREKTAARNAAVWRNAVLLCAVLALACGCATAGGGSSAQPGSQAAVKTEVSFLFVSDFADEVNWYIAAEGGENWVEITGDDTTVYCTQAANHDGFKPVAVEVAYPYSASEDGKWKLKWVFDDAESADELTGGITVENERTLVVVHGAWCDGQWRVFNFSLDWQDCELCANE